MHKRERNDDGYVVTHVSGSVGPEDFVHALEDLMNYVHEGRVFELVVHGDDLRMQGNFSDLQRFIRRGRDVLARLEAGAIAFVARSKMDYGVSRQMRALLVVENVPIEVFVDADSAEAWLRERITEARAPAA